MRSPRTLTIGTRGSALARWQTEWVLAHLTAAWPGLECRTKLYATLGDRTQSVEKPLPEIGGKGLFTEELENALRFGRPARRHRRHRIHRRRPHRRPRRIFLKELT